MPPEAPEAASAIEQAQKAQQTIVE